jgi:hypothetical protein
MSKPVEEKASSLLAGGWFAAASCLPLSLLWIEFISDSSSLAWYEILGGSLVYGPLPIAIAGVVGSRFGAAIVNGDMVSTSRQAIWQGAKVALASFFAYTILLGFLEGVFISLTEHTTGANRFIVVPLLFFGALLMIPVWAFFAVGWLAVIEGAIAGWLLLKFRLVVRRRAA